MTTQNNENQYMPLQNMQPQYYPTVPPQFWPQPQNVAVSPPRINKEKRDITVAERLLLIAAFAVAILFDRLLINYLFSMNSPKFYGVFWLCFLAVFYCFFWKKLRLNFVSWYLTACVSALCLWSFFFWNTTNFVNGEFTFISYPVIPAVIMGLVIYITSGYKLKETGAIAISWLCGFFVWPFSKISALFEALGALLKSEAKVKTKKAMLGIAITCGLLVILLPLLSGADRAFGYHLLQLLHNFNIGSLFLHLLVITVAFMFFYSFMWKTGFEKRVGIHPKINANIDSLIGSIILGTVLVLYVIFCTVQFSYLFAGTGLPGGMTYSEYAREGFSQTIAVCAINLLIFAVIGHFGEKSKVSTGLLLGLIVLTSVMLFSGFIRLGLYIDAYGMTWLRLLSAWFMIYLAVVVILCGLNVKFKKMPLVAICVLILVGWYVVLGYINPDGFASWYNSTLA